MIGDAKHQELNISFTFDETQKDKLVINVLSGSVPYQLQVISKPDLDFEDLKHAFTSNQFKVASQSPEVLKLKIAFTSFEFKNIDKLTIGTLKSTITEINDKLRIQYQKNSLLQDTVRNMKLEYDMMKGKIQMLSRINERSQKQLTKKRQDQQTRKKDELKRKEEQLKRKQSQFRKQSQLKRKQDELKRKQDELKRKQDELKRKQDKEKLDQKRADDKREEMKSDRAKSSNQQSENVKNMKESKQTTYKFSSIHKCFALDISPKCDEIWSTISQSMVMPGFVLMPVLGLVEGAVGKINSSIKFKIISIEKDIGIGLGIRNIIASNSYKFNNWGKDTRHGCFLVGTNGWSCHQSDLAHNFTQTDFQFGIGQTIRVETNINELIFTNLNKKKRFRLPINLTDYQWEQACFCVSIGGPGDKVAILSEQEGCRVQ